MSAQGQERLGVALGAGANHVYVNCEDGSIVCVGAAQ